MCRITVKWQYVTEPFFNMIPRNERLNFGNWNIPMFENSFGVMEFHETYERRMRKFYE